MRSASGTIDADEVGPIDPGDPIDLVGPEAAVPRSERRPRRLGPIGIVALAGLLAVGLTFAVRGVQRYRVDHLAGQTRTVTITYECADHIAWDQPGSSWSWIGSGRPVDGSNRPFLPNDTSPVRRQTAQAVGLTHVMTGRLHVDTTTDATFTGADGGHPLALHRVRRPYFSTADCWVA
ncbi:MAG: hypothetical protein JWM89_1038 [Acidimicrobiales bacterium]|nr:hypothetical protein [Acidimicrobiales bacterium]